MDSFICTKLVEAHPVARFRNGEVSSFPIPEPKRGLWYETGYVLSKSGEMPGEWIPQKEFEKYYLKVDSNEKLKSNVSISQNMVESFIKEKHVETIGTKTTLVRVVLVNGFEIIESSSCVDEANYNKELGAECCMDKIKDKIWFLLGFLLQTADKGIK